jgi:hypothetical protein
MEIPHRKKGKQPEHFQFRLFHVIRMVAFAPGGRYLATALASAEGGLSPLALLAVTT